MSLDNEFLPSRRKPIDHQPYRLITSSQGCLAPSRRADVESRIVRFLTNPPQNDDHLPSRASIERTMSAPPLTSAIKDPTVPKDNAALTFSIVPGRSPAASNSQYLSL